MRWTKNDERRCLQMIREGKSYPEIAETLGRNRESVAKFVCKQRKNDPGTWRRISTGKKNDQPCPVCYYGSGATKDGWKCPWADRLEPVPGWDAEMVPYYLHNTQSGVRYDRTWSIKSCPHFERG